MRTAVPLPGDGAGTAARPLRRRPLTYDYRYDQLQRITSFQARGAGLSADYSYDANGNLGSLLRHDLAGGVLDDLRYGYTNLRSPNTLTTIRDVSTNPRAFPLGGDTYAYDARGNFVGGSGGDRVTWNGYGKVVYRSQSYSGAVVSYDYDARGDRLAKETRPTGVARSDIQTTIHVRDASGTVLRTYEDEAFNDSSPGQYVLSAVEAPLYGSARVGSERTRIRVRFTGAGGSLNPPPGRRRGGTVYELSNHLGNVLATVSDIAAVEPVANAEAGTGGAAARTARVTTASDYYPFGMSVAGRTYEPVVGGSAYADVVAEYRYGFNGKEHDLSWGGLGIQDYGWRLYVPGTGRFLSVDPLTRSYPNLTPYQFASNSPIIGVDLDGLELAATTIKSVDGNGNSIKVVGDTEIKFKVLDLSSGSPNRAARASSENRASRFVSGRLSQQRRINAKDYETGRNSEVEFNLKVNVSFEQVNSISELRNNDVAIVIVDDIDYSFTDKFNNSHGAGAVVFSAGVMVIPKSQYESATGKLLEHEIGHLFDLPDLEDASERSNLMYHLGDAEHGPAGGRPFLDSDQSEGMLMHALGYKTRASNMKVDETIENQTVNASRLLDRALDVSNATYDESKKK